MLSKFKFRDFFGAFGVILKYRNGYNMSLLLSVFLGFILLLVAPVVVILKGKEGLGVLTLIGVIAVGLCCVPLIVFWLASFFKTRKQKDVTPQADNPVIVSDDDWD